MRFIIHLLLAIVVALGTGFGLSYYALTHARFVGGFQLGPWQAWPEAGAPEPDPYTLAYLSRQGALQLGRAEGIEFVATTDSDGLELDRDCTYRIDGRTPVATFWTLVAVDQNGRNIAASPGLSYLDSQHINRAADGSTVLTISKRLAAGNWLEVGGAGSFRIVLRLYDAAVFSGLGSEVGTLPAIIKEGCTA